MNVVISTTGTGGDLFPGIAVASELRVRGGDQVCFVISGGPEEATLKRYGFPFESLPVGRLKGQGLPRQALTLIGLPRVLCRARRLLRGRQAAFVLGCGGYTSGPLTLAAASLRIPCAILEKNAVAGLTNRLLSRWVKRVYLGLPPSAAYFPQQRVKVTGVPVRRELSKIAPKSAGIFTVLALGGSQGAASLNRALLEAYPILSQSRRPIRILHQTGQKNYQVVAARYRSLGTRDEVRVFDFIEKMEEVYREADFVVSRAGASTLAELIAARRPALLIPYPNAADDHQRKNALWLVEQGGAEMLLDKDLSGEALARRILHHEGDRQGLRRMAEALDRLPGRDAAATIASDIQELARQESVQSTGGGR